MKKKLSVVLLILVAVFALTSCDLLLAVAETLAGPTGTWYRYSSGYYYTLEIYAGGTGRMYKNYWSYSTSTYDIVSRFTWTYDGSKIYITESYGSEFASSYYVTYDSTTLSLNNGSRIYRSYQVY